MASSNDNVSMALFCDFENVALGVRDANYDKFDIKPVLERLLLKGSIVVKKAYCDWDRYKGFKAPMHEANFELIEIPHVRQSGKNSADIRMVVDALDLCYTKSHVDTFVIISGDSDFSPLVSKLRENAKKVIGVGVKQSTSDLLVANCDEFIFYDDLVRESRRAKRESSSEAKPATKRSPEEERARREEMDKRRSQAVEIAVNTFEALVSERGDSGKIWASVLKEAIKRRKPDFSESYYGFRTFGNLIEECKARGHLEFGRDEKSGAYVYRGSGVPTVLATGELPAADGAVAGESQDAGQEPRQESRRSRGRGRTAAERFAERQAERLARQSSPGTVAGANADDESEVAPSPYGEVEPEQLDGSAAPAEAGDAPEAERGRGRGRGNRGGRNQGERRPAAAASDAPVILQAAVELPAVSPTEAPAGAEAVPAPAKKKGGPKPPARKLKAEAQGKAGAVKPAAPEVAAEPAPAPVNTAPAAGDAAPAAKAKPAKAKPANAKSANAKPASAKPAKAEAAAKPRKPAAPRAPRPAKAAKSEE
jgi:uncharacterized protein (TIGR00288 family)